MQNSLHNFIHQTIAVVSLKLYIVKFLLELIQHFCKKDWGNVLTASMSVNCSATMMGSKDKKLKAGSSSSKPLSSCVAKGQPMCSPAETKQKMFLTTPLQPELIPNTVPVCLPFLNPHFDLDGF